MTHPLDSCRVKIQRANEHIYNLNSEIRAFLDSSYAVIRNHNTDSGQIEYRVRNVAQRYTGDKVAAIAGEVVHHLRSSFDHLAWQPVRANGNSDLCKVRARVGFSIYNNWATSKSEGDGKLTA